MKFLSTKSTFVYFLLILLYSSCNNNGDPTLTYIGVNKQDTAILSLNIVGDQFYGKYKIVHGGNSDKSGSVRGKIKGDTLIGDFFYQAYGAKDKKRVPLALLKVSEDKLHVGRGVSYTYMGIPFFSPDVPIEYDEPEFVLQKVSNASIETAL